MDDDVVCIGQSSSSVDGNDVCQLCNCTLRALGKREREEHYEEHKSPTKKPLSARKRKLSFRPAPSNSSNKLRLPCQKRRKEDQFWHPSNSDPPPPNYTPGMLSILKGALKKSHIEGNTTRAVLCYERTPHISRELFDSGWGCGYRNFLMACATLMDQKIQPLYFCFLDEPRAPGVRNVQYWIEDAWKQGYDAIGAKELGNKLVGTSKFIGTADIYVAFISRGIPCTLVDFNINESGKGLNGLTDWIVKYFSDPAKKQGTVTDVLRNASPVIATEKMPVILQFRGHSVTIVGFEVSKSKEINLLVFDPSHHFDEKTRSAALAGPKCVTFASSKMSKILHMPRSRSKSPSRKRARHSADLGDPIVISSDEEEETAHNASHFTLQAADIIKTLRWKMSRLKKHKEFQLLYFPMSDPLTPEERKARQVVSGSFEY